MAIHIALLKDDFLFGLDRILHWAPISWPNIQQVLPQVLPFTLGNKNSNFLNSLLQKGILPPLNPAAGFQMMRLISLMYPHLESTEVVKFEYRHTQWALQS